MNVERTIAWLSAVISLASCCGKKPPPTSCQIEKLPIVYDDSGILECAEIWTWCGSDWGGPDCAFDADYSSPSTPEGAKCFETNSGSNWYGHTNYAGWGVFLIHPSDRTVDLSVDTCLKFWVRTQENLKVEIQESNRSGQKFTVYLGNHGWDGTNTWQEITITASAFQGADMEKVFCPFMITVEQGERTFYIDHVRWTGQPAEDAKGEGGTWNRR